MRRIGLIAAIAALFFLLNARSHALSPPGLQGAMGNYEFFVVTGGGGSGGFAPALFAAGGATLDISAMPLKWEAGCGGEMPISPHWTSATSSDPRVFSVTAGPDNRVLIFTGMPGDATLSLLAEDGAVVEQLRLQIRATTKVHESWTSTTVQEGSTIAACYQSLFGDAETAGASLRFTVDGSLIAVPKAAEAQPCSGNNVTWFVAAKPGPGHLTMADGAEFSLVRDWTVVPASAITNVRLKANQPNLTDGTAVLTARAELVDGTQVLGPRCQWSASDPSVKITARADSGARIVNDIADVWVTKAGTFEVRCSIGTAVASATVQRR